MEPLGIKPVFERGHRAVVFNRSPIPKTLERGNLVVPCAAASLQGKAGVGAHHYRHNRELLRMLRRRSKADSRRQRVVRIEPWRMAAGTTFSLKHLLSRGRNRIRLVWIRRWAERIKK